MILVPEIVKDSLPWLKFTGEEKDLLEVIYSSSLMVGIYGGDQDIAEGIRGCWQDSLLLGVETSSKDWVEILEEILFTADELRFLVSDESPFYGLGVRGLMSPSERFAHLMSDATEGRWAPLRMRKLWWDLLATHHDDYLAAIVALEFLEPEPELAEQVTDK